MSFITKIIRILSALCLASCITPLELLPESEITDLTTCSISIGEAKRNLLLEGYEIKNLTEDSFNTDYKIDSKRNMLASVRILGTSHEIKYVVFSEGDNEIRFKTRVLQTNYGKDLYGIDIHGNSRRENIGHVTSKREVSVPYSVSNKEWHMDLKHIICP